MFHATNTHTGESWLTDEARVRAAIERDLGAQHVEVTISEMKHADLRFGDKHGNVWWHEWSGAEVPLSLLLRAFQDRESRSSKARKFLEDVNETLKDDVRLKP